MSFPNSERVLYTNNTLQQVICQLRFPSILRIDSQLPDKFQEAIRERYPIFHERTELVINQIPQQIVSLLPAQMRESIPAGKKIYDFTSADENWVITLTRESIALTARRYTRWLEFRDHFSFAFQELLNVYRPAFFLRIGLRYQNLVQRSTLGIENLAWSDLLQPYIAGPLGDPRIAVSVTGAFQTIEVDLPGNAGEARIQHGLVEAENKELCYLIDSDLFVDKQTEAKDALGTLDGFNRVGTRLFRWCISQTLHEALGPQPIPASNR